MNNHTSRSGPCIDAKQPGAIRPGTSRQARDVDAIATIPGVPVPVEVRTTIDLKPITYSLGLWYRF
jgi:hypothetical protein